MCDVNALNAKLGELEDYLTYVNTDIDKLMKWEPDLYAAYAAHNDLPIGTIKEWYRDAEDFFVSAFDPWVYICKKYDVFSDDGYDYYYEKEVHKDGTLYESGGYWFTTEG